MIWEEALSHQRERLGLLFIVPEAAMSAHWSNVGLDGPTVDEAFVSRLNPARLPKKIQAIETPITPGRFCSGFD